MKKKYEVILNTNKTMEIINEKNIIVEGNVSKPRIIDGRLVFFKDGEEIFVFNRCEWVYWKKVEEPAIGNTIKSEKCGSDASGGKNV